MSQTPCKRCRFPLPTRWPRAGGNLAQPNGILQCADHASMRSEHSPKRLPHSADLPSATHSSNPVSLTWIIELCASIKSS
jgi:hypothetical protein